jgi:hypothetical protein
MKMKLQFCLTKHHSRTGISGKLYLQVFLNFALDSGGRATSRYDKKNQYSEGSCMELTAGLDTVKKTKHSFLAGD